MRSRALVPVLLAGALAAASLATAAQDETLLVSRASGPNGAGASTHAFDASISGDGRLVAFESRATNLSDEDNDDNFPAGPARDVYARDLETATTVLASRPDGTAGTSNAESFQPAISADGRFVAFASSSSNLTSEDTSGATPQVYVRDLQQHTTVLVSRADGASGDPADDFTSQLAAKATAPSISSDGRYVAFASDADNLSTDDGDKFDGTDEDVFVRDLQQHATTLVSRADGASGSAGEYRSFAPSISADGRFVAFESMANNLSDADLDGHVPDVFVRDLEAGTTTLVSRAGGAAGAGGDAGSSRPAISGDGHLVAFESPATNLSDDDNDDPAVGDPTDVFVRDLQDNATALASRAGGAAGAGGDNGSRQPSISADGRSVAFESFAKNLSNDDADAVQDVFVRDLVAATTTLVSRASGAAGPSGDDSSYRPSVAGDGRFVAFESYADNFGDVDADNVSDIFRRELPGASGDPPPERPPESQLAQCADGVDNDGDGAVDEQDPGCLSGPDGAYNPADTDEGDEGLRELVLCGRREISLVRADVRGHGVVLSGIVAARFTDGPIAIFANYPGAKAAAFRKLASVRANADGQFTARVGRPPPSLFNKARFQARVDRFRSVALKLPQSLASTSIRQHGDTIELRGQVKRSVLGRRDPVVVRRLLCGSYQVVGQARPDRRGNYLVRFPAPASAAAALYRAEARVLARPGSKRYVKQYARAIGISLTGQAG